MIYNDIHALQRTSVRVRGRESPSLSPLVLSDGNPVSPVLLGSFSCVLFNARTCFSLPEQMKCCENRMKVWRKWRSDITETVTLGIVLYYVASAVAHGSWLLHTNSPCVAFLDSWMSVTTPCFHPKAFCFITEQHQYLSDWLTSSLLPLEAWHGLIAQVTSFWHWKCIISI